MSYIIDDQKVINDDAEVIAPTGPAAQYESVTIGTQEWMTKPLTETHYKNGDAIPFILPQNIEDDWENLTTDAWCTLFGDTSDLYYGFYYNWYAVNHSSGLAPEGWRVATKTDWETLIAEVGTNSAGKLAGKKYMWTDITNSAVWAAGSDFGSSGFGWLPGGFVSGTTGQPYSWGGPYPQNANMQQAYYWTNDQGGPAGHAWRVNIMNWSLAGWEEVGFYENAKDMGFNVRCIRDT